MPPEWVQPAVEHAVRQIERLRLAAQDFPVSTQVGRWKYDPHGTWSAGFWPGRLWLAHLLTGEAHFAWSARAWCARLAPHQLNTTTHDLGVLFGPSFVLGWHITGEEALRYGALAASATLARRHNPYGRFLRALGDLDTADQAGYTIVDTLMNLPLLYWAAKVTGAVRLAEVATQHAHMSRHHHLRPDGSTVQVFNFDPDSGAPLGPAVYQGHAIDSCWARGQAWAMYGFATTYRWTGDADYLAAACQAADWWLAHVPSTGIPTWDFAVNDVPGEPLDSSAAAIASCSLFDLAGLTGRQEYGDMALHTAYALFDGCTSMDPAEEGLLLHSTGVRPIDKEVDVSLNFGDYYYMEMLLRLARPEQYAEFLLPRSIA